MKTLQNNVLKLYKTIMAFCKTHVGSHVKSSIKKTTTYLDEHKSLAYSVLAFDVIVAFFALPLALYFKIGDEFFDYSREYLLKMSFCFTLCSLAFFNIFNTYQAMWRYLETSDIVKHIVAISLATLTFIPMKALLSQEEELPRLILLITWVVVLLITLAPRFCSYIHHNKGKLRQAQRPPLLILGTNDRTELFLKEIAQMGDFPYSAHALISLRPDEVGLNIHGVPVVTSVKDMGTWFKTLKGNKASDSVYEANDFRLVIIESPGKYLSEILHIANTQDIPLLKPTTTFSFDNSDLKELSLESLFKDPLIELTKEQAAHFTDKTVLMTNAGNGIFKPLLLTLLDLNVKQLILVDQSFEKLEKISRYVQTHSVQAKRCIVYIANMNDHAFIEHIVEKTLPDIILHTPPMPWSGETNKLSYIRTNILATEFLSYVAQKSKVKQCLFLFEPTKDARVLFYESLIKAAFMRYALEKETQFLLVNAENIIGSIYALTTHIQRHIHDDGEIILNHKDEKANFITAQQLGNLLLQALHDLRDSHALLEYTFHTQRSVFVEDIAKHMISLEKDVLKNDVTITFTDSSKQKRIAPSQQKEAKTKNPYLFAKEYVAWTETENLQYILQASDNCDEDFLERMLKKHAEFLSEQHLENETHQKVA